MTGLSHKLSMWFGPPSWLRSRFQSTLSARRARIRKTNLGFVENQKAARGGFRATDGAAGKVVSSTKEQLRQLKVRLSLPPPTPHLGCVPLTGEERAMRNQYS